PYDASSFRGGKGTESLDEEAEASLVILHFTGEQSCYSIRRCGVDLGDARLRDLAEKLQGHVKLVRGNPTHGREFLFGKSGQGGGYVMRNRRSDKSSCLGLHSTAPLLKFHPAPV